ncbi:TM2 domain-containing protein 3 isoform X3 [Podarcis muralis]
MTPGVSSNSPVLGFSPPLAPAAPGLVAAAESTARPAPPALGVRACVERSGGRSRAESPDEAKMAVAAALRALERLCRVALFLSQLYVLSGRGSLSLEHSHPQAQLAKVAIVPTSTHIPVSKVSDFNSSEATATPSYMTQCPSNGLCSRLPPGCMNCETNCSCIYGKTAVFECKARSQVHCVDEKNNRPETFTINMTCQLCWQLPPSDYVCSNPTNCKTVSCPRERYSANCTVRDHIHCLASHLAVLELIVSTWASGEKVWANFSALEAWESGLS